MGFEVASTLTGRTIAFGFNKGRLNRIATMWITQAAGVFANEPGCSQSFEWLRTLNEGNSIYLCLPYWLQSANAVFDNHAWHQQQCYGNMFWKLLWFFANIFQCRPWFPWRVDVIVKNLGVAGIYCFFLFMPVTNIAPFPLRKFILLFSTVELTSLSALYLWVTRLWSENSALKNFVTQLLNIKQRNQTEFISYYR